MSDWLLTHIKYRKVHAHGALYWELTVSGVNPANRAWASTVYILDEMARNNDTDFGAFVLALAKHHLKEA